MNNIKECQKCKLCNNQPPLLNNNIVYNGVFFVGLSAVKTNSVNNDEPFSVNTKSGSLLRSVSDEVKNKSIYFTNMVKCLPLKDNKIRYPNKSELTLCLENFKYELNELKPEKIVLFGKQVSNHFLEHFNIKEKSNHYYNGFTVCQWKHIPVLLSPHPSYILIYKRRHLEEYKQSIVSFLEY